ncbi:hypothetical protein Pelo_16157 [Pelomyxa schiedti]|nr:hypothetical protein Pelo_16157 [Pelomyxa schiedti]
MQLLQLQATTRVPARPTKVRSLLRTHGDGVTNRSRNPAEGATSTTVRDTTAAYTPHWHPIGAPHVVTRNTNEIPNTITRSSSMNHPTHNP